MAVQELKAARAEFLEKAADSGAQKKVFLEIADSLSKWRQECRDKSTGKLEEDLRAWGQH